ncbi:oligosaccharyltransferase alpha subunit [Purpureocillium lavendulum]|uniref:Dolichyl-diphosphooligosaccharide--protein glycosyltransferase subunit 1 n=1 Tax=Purpureocillium lavendulum TaxID=1247861 RepID=A0AB34G769_9HYPO|nr:oligosaccharyltransferase alpha subunit [Purpureocillium lavendulum]
MKPLSFASALFGLLATATATVSAPSSKVTLPAEFKPPQVFRNANLVHVVSLEKNYVKEQINVLIENVSKQPQDEYYLPFTADQMSRVGGFEVKDRKDTTAGPFVAEQVEYDPHSDVQYFRIRLPAPLKAGGQQTLGISFYVLKAYSPLPASIKQEDQQFLVYDFSVYAPSAYPTLKQKTEVKAPSSAIPDYTKIAGKDGKEGPQKQGSKLTYGPFDEKPAGAVSPASVRFEFTKSVLHMSSLERDIEVSHWGGNVAFEERYTLVHRGANLSSPFNRVKWAQAQYFNPASTALKEMRFPLQVGSVDPYFTDAIGNVSTSRFRSNKREALLELKPRYPIFGGWKYPFTIGWNSNTANLLRKTASGSFVLKVPFIEGPKQAEGVEYEQVNVRVLLPEGASNVKVWTGVPESAIVESSVGVHKTYLDTIGRTAVTIKARNLVDEFRDRDLIISYETSLMDTLRKPFVVFTSMMTVLVAAWALSKVEFFLAAIVFDCQRPPPPSRFTTTRSTITKRRRRLNSPSRAADATTRVTIHYRKPNPSTAIMCFWGEPNTKYYYHEEVIPARRHHHHHGHHHGHHHHHHHGHSPRASYTSVTRSRYSSSSPRLSGGYYRPASTGPVVIEASPRPRY